MQAIRLIAENVQQSSDSEPSARPNLVLAANLCGRGTDQTGSGLASVLAHAIGRQSGGSNGIVNAIVLPHTMQFNQSVTTHGRHRIAQALNGSAPAALPRIDASNVISGVQLILDQLSPARRLSETDIRRADFPAVADAAMSDWFISRTPRLVEKSDLLSLMEACW